MKLPSESELEKQLKVSMITIRAALKELELQKWIERRHGSGTYILERDLHDKHIALLLEADVTNPQLSPFYLAQLQALRVELRKHNISSRPYLGHLCPGVEIGELTCREFFEELNHDRIAGVIAVLTCKHPSWIQVLKKRSIPLVGSHLSGEVKVTYDGETITRTILSHFQSRGYKRLACLDNVIPPYTLEQLQETSLERTKRLLPEYGMHLEDSAIRIIGGSDPSEAKRAILDIWENSSSKPDAFIIQSDLIFETVVKTIQNQEGGGSVGFSAWGSDAVPVPSLPNTIHCYVSLSALIQTKVQRMRELLQGHKVPQITTMPILVQLGEMTSNISATP